MNTITVQAQDLAAALKHGVAPGKSPLETILHARLRVEGGQLRVETTDTEVWARANVPVQGDDSFDVLLRDDLLRNAVAAAADNLVIREDGKVRSNRGRYTIPTLPAQDFPSAEDGHWVSVAIDAQALATAVRTVSYCADANNPNHAFRAVAIVPGMVWSTDGKQIALVAIDYAGPRISIPVAQVPRLVAAMELLGARLEVANVASDSAGLLRVVSAELQISTRLLATPIADMGAVLRGVNLGEASATLHRESVIAALRRFMPFVLYSAGKRLPNATLTAGDGVLSIRDRTSEFVETLDADEGRGQWSVTLDPKRLLHALHAISEATVTLYPKAQGAGSRIGLICLTPEGRDLADAAHLLAPMME